MRYCQESVGSELEAMAKMESAISKRFGDEQSTLLDHYERLSFELQLNQAMMGRSLSESRCLPQPQQMKKHAKPARRGWGSGFQEAIRKFLSKRGARKDGADSRTPRFGDHWAHILQG